MQPFDLVLHALIIFSCTAANVQVNGGNQLARKHMILRQARGNYNDADEFLTDDDSMAKWKDAESTGDDQQTSTSVDDDGNVKLHSLMDSNLAGQDSVENVVEDGEDAEDDEDADDLAEQKAQLKKDLEVVKLKKLKADMKLTFFKNAKGFNAKLEAQKKAMANETAAPKLAQFLVDMRKEMRLYATPAYQSHLEAKESSLEAKENDLAAKLANLEKKESSGDTDDKESEKKAEADDKPVAPYEPAVEELEKRLSLKGENTGQIFSLTFMGTVILLAFTFGMAATDNESVRDYTWFTLDQVIAIFLAVLYFNAFDGLLDYLDLGGDRPVVSVIHAVSTLVSALALAFLVRNNQISLAVVCGAAAHVASFNSIHAGATVQNEVWMARHYSWSFCLLGIVSYCVVFMIILVLIHRIKTAMRSIENKDFMEKTDELETDCGAMGFAVLWTMFVRFVITGHHPTDDETEFGHTEHQRLMMLIYAVITIPVAGVLVSQINKIQQTSYIVGRFLAFLSSASAMNVAWAFLYWGEWEFFEVVYEGNPLFGKVFWALLASLICMLGIRILAVLPTNSGAVMGKAMKVSLTSLALVVAWSWELCFDHSMEMLVDDIQHPHRIKMAAMIIMFLVVVPVYCNHIKPISMPACEAIE